MRDTKTIYYSVLAALSVAGAKAAEVLGGWDAPLELLTTLVVIDYVLGWMIAAVWHRSPKTTDGCLESRAGFKGAIRKGVIFLVVLIAHRLDTLTGEHVARSAAIFFFASNEGVSIIENLSIMGVPFPPVVKNAFEMLKGKGAGK